MSVFDKTLVQDLGVIVLPRDQGVPVVVAQIGSNGRSCIKIVDCSAGLADPAASESCKNLVLIEFDLDHKKRAAPRTRGQTTFLQEYVEPNSLRNRSRKPIENETRIAVVFVQSFLY